MMTKLPYILVIILLLISSNWALAWSKKVHGGIAKAVAQQSGITDIVILNNLKTDSVWADTRASEDGKGTFGIDEELNLWYDNGYWIPGSNPDHWLDVYNIDRFWMRPHGAADVNAEKFLNNASSFFASHQDDIGFKLLGRGAHYIQDMGTPYHTVLWVNFDTQHTVYEHWTDEHWETLELEKWALSGALHAGYYESMSIKKITLNLARISKGYKNKIKFRRFTDNHEATQYLIWYTARALAAANAIAAPQYYSFHPSANDTKNNGLEEYCPEKELC